MVQFSVSFITGILALQVSNVSLALWDCRKALLDPFPPTRTQAEEVVFCMDYQPLALWLQSANTQRGKVGKWLLNGTLTFSEILAPRILIALPVLRWLQMDKPLFFFSCILFAISGFLSWRIILLQVMWQELINTSC